MSTIVELLENPEAFSIEEILVKSPSFLKKLIDYITLLPEPLLQN
jgi:hypothetical protein